MHSGSRVGMLVESNKFWQHVRLLAGMHECFRAVNILVVMFAYWLTCTYAARHLRMLVGM